MSSPQLKIGGIWIDVSLSEKIQLNALVTAYPINEPGSHGGARVNGTITALEEIVDQSKLVELVTGIMHYDNIVLTNLSIHRSSDTGHHAYRFTCTAHQIRFVSAQTAPKPSTNAGMPKKNRGIQPARGLTPAEAAVVETLPSPFVTGNFSPTTSTASPLR